MSKPMPGATPEYLTDRGQRDEELPGTNFEPHPGRGLVAECPVRIVLLKSWQRHINAQYVLQQFPALLPSFEAAYRRICEPVEPAVLHSPPPPPSPPHSHTLSCDRRWPAGVAQSPSLTHTFLRSQMARASKFHLRAISSGTSTATTRSPNGLCVPPPPCRRKLRVTYATTRRPLTAPSRASTRASSMTPPRCSRTSCRPQATSRDRTRCCLPTGRWTLSTADCWARCVHICIYICTMLSHEAPRALMKRHTPTPRDRHPLHPTPPHPDAGLPHRERHPVRRHRGPAERPLGPPDHQVGPAFGLRRPHDRGRGCRPTSRPLLIVCARRRAVRSLCS